MKKLGWGLSLIGFLFILCGILYPLDIITKNQFLILLLGGAATMFIGSMIRAIALVQKK
ncbi:hypothetical protein V1498_13625 [Peribacillus sp. SCS-26]|uniref:hypothetical protein n=1 Tax=Paraperibacillus marinus TaxID=3115295 RepID=UPI00390597B7